MKQQYFECAAVLFDLDGTLVDSTAIVERIWNDWSHRHQLDPKWVLDMSHGQRTYDSLKIIAPDLTDAERLQAFHDIEGREIVETDGLVVFDGTRELLSSLPADRWTVVTSGTRALAESRLRAAGLPVPSRMVTADDVSQGKPHPEPYIKGAELLGVSPALCIVIEDAPAGIRSAKAAGMTVVAVETTYPAKDLREADVLVAGVASISATIKTGRIYLTVNTP